VENKRRKTAVTKLKHYKKAPPSMDNASRRRASHDGVGAGSGGSNVEERAERRLRWRRRPKKL
jgi:hypothetical protein